VPTPFNLLVALEESRVHTSGGEELDTSILELKTSNSIFPRTN
jgi:hypothetical protein